MIDETPTPDASLGRLILRLRDEHGLSRRTFADLLGISPSYLKKIEIGTVEKASDQILSQIAYVFDLDEFELFAMAGRIHPEITRALLARRDILRLVCEKLREPPGDDAP